MATHLERAIAWEADPQNRGRLRPFHLWRALMKAGMIDTSPNSAGIARCETLNERGMIAVAEYRGEPNPFEKRNPIVAEEPKDERDGWSLKRLAWAYGCSKKGSEVEESLRQSLEQRVGDGNLKRAELAEERDAWLSHQITIRESERDELRRTLRNARCCMARLIQEGHTMSPEVSRRIFAALRLDKETNDE